VRLHASNDHGSFWDLSLGESFKEQRLLSEQRWLFSDIYT